MLKTKMNPEVKQKWIGALRSGKYEQGTEKLRSVSGYCCLGVLCDLYAQEHNTEWEFRGNEETNLQPQDYWYFDKESEFLPESVMNWAKLFRNPMLRIEDDDEMFEVNEEVSTLNDEGYSFSTIADLIEAQM
jgi:hypothetical protein